MIEGTIRVASTGRLLLGHARKTETFLERTIGLLGCKGLEQGEGLLIVPCNSIHTFFMRFSLDILFLNQGGTILKLVESLTPWKLIGCWGSAMVLEVPAGLISSSGLQIDDQLIWEVNA